MSNELMTLEQTLENQLEIVREVKRTRDEVVQIKDETQKKFSEIEEVQKKLERNITLTRGEEGKLRGRVLSKAKHLTHDFFKTGVSAELYEAKRGHTISYIWIILKDYYDVSTYPQIPHIEFDNAMNIVSRLTIEDFPEAYYRLTPKMREIAKDNDDRPMHVYFGENTDQEYLF